MLGPTAASKSAVAMLLAEEAGAEIVSVDSMQVYRGMDVGTAKPTLADRARVTHHMVDVADPADPYSVAEFQRAARSCIEDGDAPILIVGGSGLHFRSLVDPLDFAPTDPEVRRALEEMTPGQLADELLAADPNAAAHVDMANPRRIQRAVEVLRITGDTPSQRADSPRAQAVRRYEPERPLVAVGIDPVGALAGRVARRFDTMLESGLVQEVEGLVGRWGETASKAVGYREVAKAVQGEWTMTEAVARGVDATTALARRQRTYFRRDPRIAWLEWDDDPAVLAAAAGELFEEAGWIS